MTTGFFFLSLKGFLPSSEGLQITVSWGPFYTEHQHQCCDVASDITLIILLRFHNEPSGSFEKMGCRPNRSDMMQAWRWCSKSILDVWMGLKTALVRHGSGKVKHGFCTSRYRLAKIGPRTSDLSKEPHLWDPSVWTISACSGSRNWAVNI